HAIRIHLDDRMVDEDVECQVLAVRQLEVRPVRLAVDCRVQTGALAVDRQPPAARLVGDQRLLAPIWRATDLQSDLIGLARQKLGYDLQRRALDIDPSGREWADRGVLQADVATSKYMQLHSRFDAQCAVRAQ